MRRRPALLGYGLMTKRKTTGGAPHDKAKAEPHRSERRATPERRSDDRRAHTRFSPGDARIERRQGERRGPRS